MDNLDISYLKQGQFCQNHAPFLLLLYCACVSVFSPANTILPAGHSYHRILLLHQWPPPPPRLFSSATITLFSASRSLSSSSDLSHQNPHHHPFVLLFCFHPTSFPARTTTNTAKSLQIRTV